ncbi:MAG: Flp pilus assembly complex ATPase component TadA [Clostridia bacterium]|nr:Flp pilus assembly complex ATPase component TadA [Clostridia bacterium]
MDWQETREFLTPCFPEAIRSELMLLQPGELREIRIRAERPTVFITGSRRVELPWRPGLHQLNALVEALSGHSLYTRAEETGQGFITLQGGHRMGLCGRIVHRKAGHALTDMGSVCIRIAAQWPGCADPLLPLVSPGDSLRSLLVIGPPGSGKTTLLRDLARQLACSTHQVAIIDERGELAACAGAVPQLDVGPCCDVLEGLPKPQAVPWLIRAMAPDIIITDELCGAEDAAALLDAQSSGCAICASAHGSSLQEAATRPALAALMARRAFEYYAVLAPEGGGRIIALHDRSGSPLPIG